ncbi:lysyl-tRNA synthetase [Hypoxylon sp. FL1284]|nr:lysyl-tRNA synthetase [Hypoxylon sp. FL1284]
MGSRHYLEALRPHLSRLSPARTASCGRFFSVGHHRPACARLLQHARFQCLSSNNIFRNSAPRRYLSDQSSGPEDDAVASPSRRNAVDNRIQKLNQYKALRYPRADDSLPRMSIPDFRVRFETRSSTAYGARILPEVVLEGRVMSVRRSGPKLVFLTIRAEYEQVQIMINRNKLSDPIPDPKKFRDALRPIVRGDIVSVRGMPMHTDTNELTLRARTLPSILSPILAPLPEKLADQETMVLNRHVDMLVNPQTSDLFRLRSSIIKCMRDHLHSEGFMEVQTPILSDCASGAAARPFVTSSTELPQKELALRIAPELWLKRLVVGGNDKVFEIGPSFRNEGIDKTHNPEFTMCEFYAAYATLADLMSMTRDLIIHIYETVRPETIESLDYPKSLVGRKRWREVEFIPGLEQGLNIRFPDLSKPGALAELMALVGDRLQLTQGPELTLAKVLDALSSKYLEPLSHDKKLFIMHHPACMAPLSKSFICPKTGQLVSARAEFFIDGHEIANMYEEENDPREQRRKFEQQLESRNGKPGTEDEGPAEVDESYIRALEYGLPPTGGWGCGVDRLVMHLSRAERIGDVLSFGNLRNVVSLRQAAKDD